MDPLRSTGWLMARWLAQIARARDTGAVAILLTVPAHSGFSLRGMTVAAKTLGLRLKWADEIGQSPIVMCGPLPYVTLESKR